MSHEEKTESNLPQRSPVSYKIVAIVVVIVLTGLYVATFIPEIPKDKTNLEDISYWMNMFRNILVVFGMAFLASLVVDAAFTRWAIQDLKLTANQAVTEATKELQVLDGCKRSGVENVFPTRDLFYDYLADMLKSLDRGTVVKIIGISLRDFFREGPSAEGAFSRLRDAFQQTKQSELIKYRLCLLDPQSPSGQQRSFREETVNVEYISSTGLFNDVTYAVETYLRESGNGPKQCPCPQNRNASYSHDSQWRPKSDLGACESCNRSVCMCLYETSPHCFLVELPESVFVEQYHYGKSGGGRKGGQAPVLQLSKNAHAFSHLKGHFEYVWTTGCIVTKDVERRLRNAIIAETQKEENQSDLG